MTLVNSSEVRLIYRRIVPNYPNPSHKKSEAIGLEMFLRQHSDRLCNIYQYNLIEMIFAINAANGGNELNCGHFKMVGLWQVMADSVEKVGIFSKG